MMKLSGERGIRTPGAFRHNGFQDRHLRPLGHLSAHGCIIFSPKILSRGHRFAQFSAAQGEEEILLKVVDGVISHVGQQQHLVPLRFCKDYNTEAEEFHQLNTII